MSRSNTKKGSKQTACRSPVQKEPEQDENAYSKILENANKRNELLKLRKEAKKAKKGSSSATSGGTQPIVRCEAQQVTSRKSQMSGLPDMLRGFFTEKDVVGMSTEMKADGTMTHTFHFKRQPKVKEVGDDDDDDEDDDDDDDEDDDDSDSDSDSGPSSRSESSSSSGPTPRKFPKFSTRSGTYKRTVTMEGAAPDDASLGDFLSQLSAVLKENGSTSSTTPKFKFTCSEPKGCQTSPMVTPAPGTPVKKPTAPKPEAPKVQQQTPVETKVTKVETPKAPVTLTATPAPVAAPAAPAPPQIRVPTPPQLKSRSIQTDEMDCTETCSKCARTSEHCSRAQKEAEEAQSQAKKFEEKAGRTDAVEKKCKEMQKEAKKASEEKEKRDKEVKKMEKNHANELRKKDREMETFKVSTDEAAEKVAKSHADALKKANAKAMSLESQVSSLKEEMKQVQQCMDSFSDVEVWLKTEKLKCLKLEEELANLKRQERKCSPTVWNNLKAKEDAEEIEKLKYEIQRTRESDRAQASVNAQLATQLLEGEAKMKMLEKLRIANDEAIRNRDKTILELSTKSGQLETDLNKLKLDFRIRESENKVIGKEKNKIDELKLENKTLEIRLSQQEVTIDALIQQIAKGNLVGPLTNGLAHLNMRTDIPPPPSRSTWSTMSTSSDSPPAAYVPTPIQPPRQSSQPPHQQEQRIPNIPEWMKTVKMPPVHIPPPPIMQTQKLSQQVEPTPEWMSAKNSDLEGDWVGALLPDDDDDVSASKAPVNSLVQTFGGFRPLIPDRLDESKCFVCLWDIKPSQTTLSCGICRRRVHEQCGMKLEESGEPCWGCEQRKRNGYHTTTKA